MTVTDVSTIEVEHRDGAVPVHLSGGDAPGVLLLAGGNSASRDYYPRVREAFPECQVIGIDRPGTGRARGFSRFDMAYSCGVLADVLRQVTTGPVVAVGHSFGAVAAVQLAVDSPDLVRSVLLLDPTPFDDQLVLRGVRTGISAARAAARVPGVADRLKARHNATWRRSLGPLDPDAERSLAVIGGDVELRARMGGISSSPRDCRRLVPRLGEVAQPVVLVSADHKRDMRSVRSHQRLAQALGAELRTWPGTAHALQLQRPGAVVEVIRELLALPYGSAGGGA